MGEARLREIRLWDDPCEKHTYERRAYERHAYEMAPVRSTSMRDASMRDTPIKCPSIGDVCLGDTFNQPIQIAFTTAFGTIKWPRSSPKKNIG
jgi:hypothetical protein